MLPSSIRYVQGLVFIFLVALIWAASSVLVQFLYLDFSFDSPFLLTYIGSSLFTLWLPTKHLSIWFSNRSDASSTPTATATATVTAGPRDNNPTHVVYQDITSSPSDTSLGENDEEDDHRFASPIHTSPPPQQWTREQHMRAAIWVAPVWFIANWSYNASLKSTSITSSTVLASTGSLFTFLFAILAKDERFGWIKLMGVLLGVTGSCLTAFSDTSSNDNDPDEATDPDTSSLHWIFLRRLATENSSGNGDPDRALLGDLLGLLSAIGYGGYAVQTRLLCPHDESLYSMQLLLGYIGLFSFVALSPVTMYILFFENVQISWFVLGALVVKGLFDNVLSDYLWLRAVILTNATIATVGLGMTIPLAFISDVWMGKQGVFSPLSVMGAVSVLAGFVFVNVGNNDSDSHDIAAHHSQLHQQQPEHSTLSTFVDDEESSDNSMEELRSMEQTS